MKMSLNILLQKDKLFKLNNNKEIYEFTKYAALYGFFQELFINQIYICNYNKR